jgi:S-DNA-T family DNA segregation ATPase FtsK/SpoIIIE
MAKNRIVKFGLAELWALAIIGAGIFTLLSLISYNPNDVSYYLSPPNRPAHNLMGPAGAWIAFGLYFALGFASYTIPLFLTGWGIFRIKKLLFKKRTDIYIFALCLAITNICGLFTLLERAFTIQQNFKLISIGGLIGTIITDKLTVKYFGIIGASLIMGTITAIALIYLSEMRVVFASKWLFTKIIMWSKWIYTNIIKTGVTAFVLYAKELLQELHEKRKAGPEIRIPPTIKSTAAAKTNSTTPIQKQAPLIQTKQPEPFIKSPPVIKAPPTAVNTNISKPATQIVQPPKPTDKYILPPLDLLEAPHQGPVVESKDNLTQSAKILEDTFKEFGINVQVTGIQPGPVVTLYELILAPGTKIGKITVLSDDIALAMRVGSVRIIAPIPGKSAIGIEVPNVKPRFVFLKEVASTTEFQKPSIKIPMALGMDVAGSPLVADLSEMPHLLIAGTTGSGKTVCLNAIILSILVRKTPEEVKFLMVDPKMVELAAYKNLPHLLVPVIHDPKKASLGLAWVVREMERRYELLARAAVRNIEGYNNRPESKNPQIEIPPGDDGFLEVDYEKYPPPTLPYIVIVIDELADLMMVAPADIEIAIARLAQLSRAVGIHIILATQRPSVDVLTGVIKANFSTRISFQVASRVDSRTVLDTNGADSLLGKGDMLFMPPGTSKLIRAQCTLIKDLEINKVVDFITAQRKAQFTPAQKEGVFQKLQTMKESQDEEDPLFNECVDIILANQQASVSILQRKLKIGYNRAARIVDMMEARGILGPLEDGKREILINRTEIGIQEQ